MDEKNRQKVLEKMPIRHPYLKTMGLALCWGLVVAYAANLWVYLSIPVFSWLTYTWMRSLPRWFSNNVRGWWVIYKRAPDGGVCAEVQRAFCSYFYATEPLLALKMGGMGKNRGRAFANMYSNLTGQWSVEARPSRNGHVPWELRVYDMPTYAADQGVISLCVPQLLTVLLHLHLSRDFTLMCWAARSHAEILLHYMKKADELESEVVKLKHDKDVLKTMVRRRQASAKKQRNVPLEKN